MAKKHFTAQQAAAIVRRLGLPMRGFSSAELARGMDVELEHGSHDPRTDITHDDAIMTAKIALAHLYETPDYYKKLKRARLNPARYRTYDPARARELRLLEQRTSPTQSRAARRARDYGGVGYYPTTRDIANRFSTGTLVRIRYGKTTGSGQYDERVWRVTSKGLQAAEGRLSWTPYTDSVKRRLGSSLAILSVTPLRY